MLAVKADVYLNFVFFEETIKFYFYRSLFAIKFLNSSKFIFPSPSVSVIGQNMKLVNRHKLKNQKTCFSYHCIEFCFCERFSKVVHCQPRNEIY